MKKQFALALVACTMFAFAVSTASAVPRRGPALNRAFELIPIDPKLAKEGRVCGKYFVKTKDFKQTVFIWSSQVLYSDREQITVVVDNSLKVPTATFVDVPSGPWRIVIRLPAKEAKKAQPCLSAPKGV